MIFKQMKAIKIHASKPFCDAILFIVSDVAVYKLKVETGDLPTAGTQANVYVNFHGAYGDTGSFKYLLDGSP